MVTKVHREAQPYLKRRRDGQDRQETDRSIPWSWWCGLFGLIACSLAVFICPSYAADPALFRAAHLERFAQKPSLADVSLQDVDGKTIALRAFQGQIVLLNFWTTW